MTTIRTTAHSRPSAVSYASGFVVMAARLATETWKALANRRSVRNLADLDDYMLADIGLTRMDVDIAGTLPIHTDPTLHLAAMAGMRGTGGEMIVRNAVPPGRRLP